MFIWKFAEHWSKSANRESGIGHLLVTNCIVTRISRRTNPTSGRLSEGLRGGEGRPEPRAGSVLPSFRQKLKIPANGALKGMVAGQLTGDEDFRPGGEVDARSNSLRLFRCMEGEGLAIGTH